MLLLNQIKSDQLIARKAKDEKLATLLTTLYSEAANVGKNQGNRDSTDTEVISVVKKFAKNNEQNIEIYTKANKTEALEMAKFELSVLEKYLPKSISVEDLKIKIVELINDNNLPKENSSMGKIMKLLKELYGDSLDGSVASKVIKETLS